MNWLDLGIIVLLIIFLIIGIKKGFMNSLLSHFSFGINALLSFFLCKPISSIYNLCGLGSSITGAYSTKLLGISADFGKNLLELSETELSGFVSYTIGQGKFSWIERNMFNLFINNNSLYSKLHSSSLESRTMAEIISNSYSSFFVTIISFVTSVLLLYLVVWLFKLMVNKLRTVGFIKFVDNTLGIVYGVFRCFIVLVIIGLVIKLISPFGFMQPVISYINGSFFGKFIYSTINNFFDNWFNFADLVRAIFK